jgi:hypothetical protein
MGFIITNINERIEQRRRRSKREEEGGEVEERELEDCQ